MADRDRIEHALSNKNRDIKHDQLPDYCPYRYGSVVIAKAYIGNSRLAPETKKRYKRCIAM